MEDGDANCGQPVSRGMTTTMHTYFVQMQHDTINYARPLCDNILYILVGQGGYCNTL